MSSFVMQLTNEITLTIGVAVILSFLGLREGLLRARPEPRRCPSCGQRLHSWTCSSCARSRRS